MSQTSIIFAAIVIAYVIFTVMREQLNCWLEILGISSVQVAGGGTCCSQVTANAQPSKIILQPGGGGVPPAVGVGVGPGGVTVGGTVSGPGGTVRVPGVTIPGI